MFLQQAATERWHIYCTVYPTPPPPPPALYTEWSELIRFGTASTAYRPAADWAHSYICTVYGETSYPRSTRRLPNSMPCHLSALWFISSSSSPGDSNTSRDGEDNYGWITLVAVLPGEGIYLGQVYLVCFQRRPQLGLSRSRLERRQQMMMPSLWKIYTIKLPCWPYFPTCPPISSHWRKDKSYSVSLFNMPLTHPTDTEETAVTY
jgi:hypothetical protein